MSDALGAEIRSCDYVGVKAEQTQATNQLIGSWNRSSIPAAIIIVEISTFEEVKASGGCPGAPLRSIRAFYMMTAQTAFLR